MESNHVENNCKNGYQYVRAMYQYHAV